VANASKAREKVDSLGRVTYIEKPQIRRSERSMLRRSISALVVPSPSIDLATNALASQARSAGGRPMPHHAPLVNSSIRTHSSVWIKRSSLGASVPTCSRIAGINSCCTTFQRCMIISGLVLFMAQAFTVSFWVTPSCQRWPPAPLFAPLCEINQLKFRLLHEAHLSTISNQYCNGGTL